MKAARAYMASLGRLEAVAFIAGFCLLAYELVSARLLAPYIGSSIYVWTSVIGVIILALSLGYAFGGWLADKRVQTLDVAYLLLLSAGGICATLIIDTAILEAVLATAMDPRLQALVASLILFAPASFILGSISPYLARLKLKSVATTGRTIASLSAVNSLGGITGTLVTGFVLFGYVGTNQVLVLLVATLGVSSWLAAPGAKKLERAVLSGVLVGLALWALSPSLPKGVIADIDTPSSHYRVLDISAPWQPFRVLATSPGAWQSGVANDGSNRLVFWYAGAIADIVRQAPKHDSILIIGGGAYSLPRYFSDIYPKAKITVVEIDPELAKIAEKHFFYQQSETTAIVTEDARTYLEKNDEKFDVIVVDAFGETSIPFTLTTKEYAASLGRATHDRSRVIANLIVGSQGACGQLFSGIDASYKESFGYGAYFPHRKDSLATRQNVVAVYAKESLGVLPQAGVGPIASDKKQVFTDNFAPTEKLNFACKAESSAT